MANSTAAATKPENKKSQLLYDDENALIFSLLGRKCWSLSTAVIQLLLSRPPDHLKWDIKCTGVVCFVRDNPKRSYFIRVYDFDRKMLIWEQELYTSFEYRCHKPVFHIFEAHDCMAGLYFADLHEAKHFSDTIIAKIDFRKKKISEKTRPDHRVNHNMPTNFQPITPGVSLPSLKLTNNQFKNNNKNDKNRKKKVSKTDISTPTNFQHLQHIGYDSETGSFTSTKIDDKLLEFLTASGISKEMLKDEKTVNFIHEFADSHGGMDKIVKEFEPSFAPAPPSIPPVPIMKPTTIVPSKNGYHSNGRNHQPSFPAPPPPLPSHSNSSSSYSTSSGQARKQTIAPSIPVAPQAPLPPPPPPPPPSSEPNMSIPNGSVSNSSINNSMGAPPPPPPPPPPPSFTSSISNTASGTTQKTTPAPMSSNQALLEAIRKGTRLNHVEPTEVANKNNSVNSGDVRGQLFEQIRKGVGLRKVEPNSNKPESKSQSSNRTGGGGLADALARALQERSRALNQTDDSSNDDSNSDDDDEWDDRST